MATIRSFRAYRPRPDVAGRVAALPYDVYNRQEAEIEVKREPLSFLKVDRAETSFGPDVDTYAPCVYDKAGQLLQGMIDDGTYIMERRPVYYIFMTGVMNMATIRSFRAYRPRPDVAGRVAALPYDVYNRQEAEIEVKREPLSFLKVDRAETSFGPDVDTYAPCVYDKAGQLLQGMIDDGTYIMERRPVYYIYELIMDGRHQTGLVACASIDDYINGVIKKHENTREDKEIDRIKHVEACGADRKSVV